MRPEFTEQSVVCFARGRRVGVHAYDAHTGDQKPQLLLDPLCAVAHPHKVLRPAVRAFFGQRHMPAAPMADKLARAVIALARVVGH